MRLAAVAPGLSLLAACAGSPTDNTQPVDRACSVSDCFYERDVRDFEVIDDTTLIVYVGGQRCPFHIELDGVFCDMTMAPEVYFRSPSRSIDEERTFGSSRICSNDRQIGVDGGPFTESIERQRPDAFGGVRSQCRVLSIASLTDDELVELYVARGVTAPPPPVGPGEIEVSDADREPAAEEDAQDGAPRGSESPSSSTPDSVSGEDGASIR
jgi:hypothetical protein